MNTASERITIAVLVVVGVFFAVSRSRQQAIDAAEALSDTATYYSGIAEAHSDELALLNEQISEQTTRYSQDSLEWVARAESAREEAASANRRAREIEERIVESDDSVVAVEVFKDYKVERDIEVAAVTLQRDDLLVERDSMRALRESLFAALNEANIIIETQLKQTQYLRLANAAMEDALRATVRRSWIERGVGIAIVAYVLSSR